MRWEEGTRLLVRRLVPSFSGSRSLLFYVESLGSGATRSTRIRTSFRLLLG